MREIKFRGWDEKNKEMVYNINLLFSNRLNDCFEEYEECGLKIMQYTGLTDINDIEICENDLVKYYGYEEFLLVVFDDGAFGLKFPLKTIPLNKWLIDNKKIEIVGHVYE